MTYSLKSLYEAFGECKWRDFAYFMANAQHVLGPTDLATSVREYCLLRDYADRQSAQDLRGGFPCSQSDRQAAQEIASVPGMFVSFHYGAYRTLPLRLLSAGISVCVVISRDLLADYSSYYRELLSEPLRGAELYFLAAEDPMLFFRLKGMVNRGVHPFVYADGARGALDPAREKALRRVIVKNAGLRVRCGFLDLAYLLGIPVNFLLDISGDPGQCRDFRVFGRYGAHGSTTREEFVDSAVKDIFGKFSGQLEKEPFLWESWFYLHRYFLPVSDQLAWDPSDRLVPIRRGKYFYLLDKYSYRVHEIGECQFNELLK
ncbi:hypothetical protein [Sphingobacterium sp.]|uniref:hypothetical protein n=1 Tax=Sphingobacterium sp. TaxID=341027 RepID=UPI0028ADCB2A|nr:hypothetical protein [Sphingobacterium sp.]